MSTVTELKPVQGCMRVAFDDAPSLRIRKCHFAKLPLEEGDEIDPEEYVNRVASLQFADAYESALTSLDASARTASDPIAAASADTTAPTLPACGRPSGSATAAT